MDFGYETQVGFPVVLHAAPSLKPGKVHLDARVSWLVCAAQCLPGKAHLGLDLTVVPGPLPDPPLVGALGAAINTLPKPLPANMSAAAVGDAKRIGLTLHTGSSQTQAQVYPFDQDQIDNAAPQGVEPLKDGFAGGARAGTVPRGLAEELSWAGRAGRRRKTTISPCRCRPELLHRLLPGAKNGPAPAPADASVTLFGEILLAFGGGLLLNLMPCVFPVLFLKGLSLVHSSNEEKRRQRSARPGLHAGNSGFVLGGGGCSAAAAGGRAAGGLGLPDAVARLCRRAGRAGVFFWDFRWPDSLRSGFRSPSAGGGLAQKQGLAGSFFTGVLATVVATPCMGPMLGAAVGFALSQPVALTFLIFTALAVGLALPYLVLTLQPQWTSILPKPGAWMEVLKQLTAVPLFATAIWLNVGLWAVVRRGREHWWASIAMALLLLSFLVLAIAGWALGRWPARWGSAIAALVLIVLALALPLRPQPVEAQAWQPWSPDTLAAARSVGRSGLYRFHRGVVFELQGERGRGAALGR